MDKVFELGRLYHEALEFPDRDWLEERYRRIGERWGVKYAEEYDAWESAPGLVTSLLPAARESLRYHPERTAEREATADDAGGDDAGGDDRRRSTT